ncbi:hypothetical protein RKE29_03260 [Streptomyces sp. B1866]|uniref:hypothetical protein n=1 Tax=Streptomyces sp. B1866 TaxID=3075431 RepID=UPI00288C67BD|nr:hypothetical protein [Streptomyces sp. B1866]MDT3395675.1 hypothetical protein [Streptomyces sp. B1866]
MSFGQGGAYGPGGRPPSTPDWAALAEDAERRRRRRRLLLTVGGGVLATGAVAAIVATAVISSDGKGGGSGRSASHLPTPQDLPSQSAAAPEPTFSDVAPPAPVRPLDVISDARRDTAPLRAEGLFPGRGAAAEGRTYAKAATSSTRSCAAAAQGRLGAVLTGAGCRQVFRATYERDGVAVTVGIAVFDTRAAAERAKARATPNIASLAGRGVPAFCRRTACRTSANAIGRYAYFTVSGYTSGKAVTTSDTAALQAGRDLADYAFRQLLARGEAQASAAASAG